MLDKLLSLDWMLFSRWHPLSQKILGLFIKRKGNRQKSSRPVLGKEISDINNKNIGAERQGF